MNVVTCCMLSVVAHNHLLQVSQRQIFGSIFSHQETTILDNDTVILPSCTLSSLTLSACPNKAMAEQTSAKESDFNHQLIGQDYLTKFMLHSLKV